MCNIFFLVILFRNNAETAEALQILGGEIKVDGALSSNMYKLLLLILPKSRRPNDPFPPPNAQRTIGPVFNKIRVGWQENK